MYGEEMVSKCKNGKLVVGYENIVVILFLNG